MKIFLDANILVRLFTDNDEPRQLEFAKRLFEQAENGEVALILGPPVLFELAWTLRARYKTPKEKILDILAALLSRPGLTVLDQELATEAVEMAQNTGVEFADCYIAASARSVEADCLATFNRRHFSALSIPVVPTEAN
jgi:predicted nucleic acid-binding protein